jgi:hypothetical protein
LDEELVETDVLSAMALNSNKEFGSFASSVAISTELLANARSTQRTQNETLVWITSLYFNGEIELIFLVAQHLEQIWLEHTAQTYFCKGQEVRMDWEHTAHCDASEGGSAFRVVFADRSNHASFFISAQCTYVDTETSASAIVITPTDGGITPRGF